MVFWTGTTGELVILILSIMICIAIYDNIRLYKSIDILKDRVKYFSELIATVQIPQGDDDDDNDDNTRNDFVVVTFI